MEYQTKNNTQKFNSYIHEVEANYFIGRQKKIELFKQLLQSGERTVHILHHYGTGGVGKSFLLKAYERIARERNNIYIQLEAQEFNHTPNDFIEYFLNIVFLTTNMDYLPIKFNSVENCQAILNELSTKKKLVISMDSYEYMNDLDRWFQQVFMNILPVNSLVILAGRRPLKNSWKSASNLKLKQLEIQEFTYEQSSIFLQKFGINDQKIIDTLWKFTEGHPLTLSLATLTANNNYIETSHQQINHSHILFSLTKQWIKEVQIEDIRHILYIIAFLYHFDRHSLSAILKMDISNDMFKNITSLSFVNKTTNGWKMHDLIRDAIAVELKQRHPKLYNTLAKQVAEFYMQAAVKTKSQHDTAMFFYHIRNEFIQSTFFQNTEESSLYIETVDEYNFPDVIRFFEYKKEHLTDSKASFYNRPQNQTFNFYASIEHNEWETKFLGPDYVQKMGYESTSLLKNKNGETIGIAIIIPINQQTLPHLTQEPVSRAYFQTLSKKQLEQLSVSPSKNAGSYIRHLDFIDPSNSSAISSLLYHLFTLSLPGGIIIASSPVQLFQELLKSFGFQTVEGATSYDYGKNQPSPTYLLDVTGTKFDSYLRQFIPNDDYKLKIVAESLSLTDRETIIMQSILEDKTNQEIADELYIAEVTVKKHISRILKKANVKNRTQLIKHIMNLV